MTEDMNSDLLPNRMTEPPRSGGHAPEKTSFTITELAREFGVSLRALRFYEDKGLLAPMRRGQTRIYSRRDRARLILILRGKRVGFSLADIREMLDLYDTEEGHEAQLRVSLDKFRRRIEILERQRQDIDGAIDELKHSCAKVERMLAEKAGGDRKVHVVGFAVAPGREDA